jgi:hypothetical protein
MFHNNTDGKTSLLMDSSAATFLVIFNSLQIIFGSIANIFEIVFFLRKRHEHHSASDKLTLNLAVADFVALTTYLPWRTHLLHIRRTTEDYKYYTSLFVFCIFNTGNAILLIGIDRFIAVTRPLRYHALVTSKLVRLGVTLSWCTALALCIGHKLSYGTVIRWIKHKEYEFTLSLISIFQMILMSIIYTVILRTARTQVKNVSSQLSHLNSESSKSTKSSASILHIWKTACTTFCIVCLFYATFMPYSVYRIITHFDHTISKTSKRITWRWLMSFTFLNSCLNPYIYFIGMKKFRSAFKRLLNIS